MTAEQKNVLASIIRNNVTLFFVLIVLEIIKRKHVKIVKYLMDNLKKQELVVHPLKEQV